MVWIDRVDVGKQCMYRGAAVGQGRGECLAGGQVSPPVMTLLAGE